jgi:hypothetical protein
VQQLSAVHNVALLLGSFDLLYSHCFATDWYCCPICMVWRHRNRAANLSYLSGAAQQYYLPSSVFCGASPQDAGCGMHPYYPDSHCKRQKISQFVHQSMSM